MRETRKSSTVSQQQVLNDVRQEKIFNPNFYFVHFSKKKLDVIRQAVAHEYTKLFHQIHKAAQKTVR